MFLANIELKNVRSLRHFKLSFLDENDKTRKWTYILGENGTGKSTLLRAIALITAGSNSLAELLGDPNAWIHIDHDDCMIRAEFRTAKNEPRLVELVIKRGDRMTDVLERNRSKLIDLDDALEHTVRNYPVIAYGVTRRSGSVGGFSVAKDLTPFKNPRSQSVATLFSTDARLTSVENWAMDLEYRRGKEGLQIIQSAFSQLIPDVTFREINRDQRQLMFNTPDGVIPFHLLSDGYQTIVGWIGDLLYRVTETFSNYKDPLKVRAVLMLDEIELHLHPIWQRKLSDFLSRRLPNFQIITTTHAPMTAHQAGYNELFIIKRRSKRSQPELFPYEAEPRKLMLHQLLQTPAFGLNTLDSRYIEVLRDELQKLREKKTKTNTQELRLGKIREILSDLPDWRTQANWEKRQQKLLEDIEKSLNIGELALGAGRKEKIAIVNTRATAKKKETKKKATKKKVAKKKATKKKVAKKK